VGFDLDGSHLRAAQSAGSIDHAAADLADAVREAQLVVIATPVRAAEVLLREISVFLRDGAVVTDTCSTKAQVTQWAARALPRRVGFVGGHPMTGKATANVDGADGALFQGTTYCLTPTADTPPTVVERATWLVEAVGAFPTFSTPMSMTSSWLRSAICRTCSPPP
jgi:prephenate dehydrogenase